MKKLLLLILLVCMVPLSAKGQKKNKHELRAERIDAICDSLKSYYTETESGLEFSRVIQAPNYPNKDELYNKCLELMATAYKDAKEVIQNKDKEQGLIFGKGVFVRDQMSALGVNTYRKSEHTIKVEIKEGRFKVTLALENMYMKISAAGRFGTTSEYTYPIKAFYPFWKECPLKKIDDSFNNISFCFTDAIGILEYFEKEVNKPINSSNDDW